MPLDIPLELRPLLKAKLSLKPSVDVGKGPFGYRSIVEVDTGSFEFMNESDFAGFRGTILPGAADYALFSSDGKTVMINVRSILKTTEPDKVLLCVQYQSAVELTSATIERLRTGGELSERESRFVTQPHFEIGEQYDGGRNVSARFERLNRAAILAHAQLSFRSIEYTMYEVVNRFA
jgi:hypothetical protein